MDDPQLSNALPTKVCQEGQTVLSDLALLRYQGWSRPGSWASLIRPGWRTEGRSLGLEGDLSLRGIIKV